MKRIHIEITDNEPIEKQLMAVMAYVKKNRVFGSEDIKQTIDYGEKIFHNAGANHVICKKTKTGSYVFIVRRAF